MNNDQRDRVDQIKENFKDRMLDVADSQFLLDLVESQEKELEQTIEAHRFRKIEQDLIEKNERIESLEAEAHALRHIFQAVGARTDNGQVECAIKVHELIDKLQNDSYENTSMKDGYRILEEEIARLKYEAEATNSLGDERIRKAEARQHELAVALSGLAYEWAMELANQHATPSGSLKIALERADAALGDRKAKWSVEDEIDALRAGTEVILEHYAVVYQERLKFKNTLHRIATDPEISTISEPEHDPRKIAKAALAPVREPKRPY